MALIKLAYKPRKVFRPYHARHQRWACLVAHRRCGKTVACIMDMLARAIRGPKDGRYAYVAPFLSQGKEIAWSYMKRYALPVVSATNESELWVRLWNGATIRIHGADNPDRLRGAFLDGVVLDEAADMRPSLWGEVVRPMLADRCGWATWIGTPKGHNSFYSIMYGGDDSPAGLKGAVGNPDWYSVTLRASETDLLLPAEINDMRKTMSPDNFLQELECSFEASIRGSYLGHEMADVTREGRITSVPHCPDLLTHTAWDLGIGDTTAVWYWQVTKDGRINVIDHHEEAGIALAKHIEIVRSKGYEYGNHYLPHDAKQRELIAGRGVAEEFAKWQFPRVLPQMKIMDRINAARLTLPRCWFDQERCWSGIESLRLYRADWDEKAGVYRKEPKHDSASHTADAFCYLAAAWREMQPEAEKIDPIKALLPADPTRTKMTLDEMIEAREMERA